MSLHPLDTYNFRQMIIDSPQQFEVGLQLARGIRVPGAYTSIMISGMGGSALPGDLLQSYVKSVGGDKDVRIYMNRSYALPKEGYTNCLHILSSYSGNTEETIASFTEALEKGLPCVGVSSGGTVEAMCAKHGIPHIKLPIPMPGFQPRIGTGYFFGVLAQLLINHDLIPDTTSSLLEEALHLGKQVGVLEEAGRVLSQSLIQKTPVVYASDPYGPVAMVWKIKFNEHAKVPAFWNVFPELNHNEMVGFTHPQAPFAILMLRDPKAHPQIHKRYEVTKNLLQKQGVGVQMIDLSSTSVFYAMFESILLADFTAYYLALAYNQDPTPVYMVEELKKML